MMSFLEINALYVVLIITLVVWGGIAIYLNKIDASVKELEQKINR